MLIVLLRPCSGFTIPQGNPRACGNIFLCRIIFFFFLSRTIFQREFFLNRARGNWYRGTCYLIGNQVSLLIREMVKSSQTIQYYVQCTVVYLFEARRVARKLVLYASSHSFAPLLLSARSFSFWFFRVRLRLSTSHTLYTFHSTYYYETTDRRRVVPTMRDGLRLLLGVDSVSQPVIGFHRFRTGWCLRSRASVCICGRISY